MATNIDFDKVVELFKRLIPHESVILLSIGEPENSWIAVDVEFFADSLILSAIDAQNFDLIAVLVSLFKLFPLMCHVLEKKRQI